MSIDPRAAYDAITAELALTASVTPGQMFGMPCLKAVQPCVPKDVWLFDGKAFTRNTVAVAIQLFISGG